MVASLAEAWIEIYGGCCACPAIWVASLAEAWIEIWAGLMCLQRARTSPPSRRRGLKAKFISMVLKFGKVASLAEAWIEIGSRERRTGVCRVASLAEAWIEIRALYGWVCTWQGRLPRGGVD